MKRIISLLLTVTLVMSVMTFNVMASTDVRVVANPEEDDIAIGKLTASTNSSFSANRSSDVEVVVDENDSKNKIFVLSNGVATKYDSSTVLCCRLISEDNFATSSVNKFSAKIMLPTVDDADAVTEVFIPRGPSGYSTQCAKATTFSVTLKNGGAYYYDFTTETVDEAGKVVDGLFVPFVEDGTMEANKWYRIEAIMDNRQTTYSKSTSKVYMNAFIYDEEDNLIGTSGWRLVGNTTTYAQNHTSYLSSQIQMYCYDDDMKVKVDDFKIYRVEDIPEYSILSAEKTQIGVTPDNKYINASRNGNYRSLVAWLNSSATKLVSEESAIKGVRLETSFRLPKLPADSKDSYSLLGMLTGRTYKADGTPEFNGPISIDVDGLKVLEYNGSKYATPVALDASSNTAIAILDNTWYHIVMDIDYTKLDTPVAKVTVTDNSGEIVAQNASFNVSPMIFDNNKRTLLAWSCPANKKGVIHIDNTYAYVAETVTALNNPETRTVKIADDFEVYDDDKYEVGAKYVGSINVSSNKSATYNGTAVVETCIDATVAFEKGGEPIWDYKYQYSDGLVLDNADPFGLKFVYTQPIPADKVNKSNIEFYANGVKMESGYTIELGTLDDNNCVNDFTVTATNLTAGCDYSFRLKAEISDYNVSKTGGVHAYPGLYKDFTFSVPQSKLECEVNADILDAQGSPYGSATLKKDDVINANIAISNTGDGLFTCYGILAVYDGDKLLTVQKTELISVPVGETVEDDTVTYKATKDGLTAKLFVWNNFELMIPYSTPVVLGQ